MARNAILVALLGLGWGVNWAMVRLALEEIQPWTLRACAFSGATLLMFGAFAATRTSVAVPRRHWLRLAALGALTVVAYNLLSAFAQLSASTSRSIVLSYTMPVWAVIFARLLLGEPLDRRRLIGLGLGCAGLAAFALPLLRGGDLSWGLAFALGSGIVWAAGSVGLKRWPVAASPLVITAWQLALGAVLTVAGALAVEGWPARLPTLGATWLGLGYNLVIGQAVATSLWFTILARMPAGTAAIGSLLVPGIGVVGATLILGEHPTVADWVGLVLIVAASATVLLRPSLPERSDAETDRSPVRARVV